MALERDVSQMAGSLRFGDQEVAATLRKLAKRDADISPKHREWLLLLHSYRCNLMEQALFPTAKGSHSPDLQRREDRSQKCAAFFGRGPILIAEPKKGTEEAAVACRYLSAHS